MTEKKEKQYVSDNAQLMTEWNWEKNTEISPDKIMTGSGKTVWWKCLKGCKKLLKKLSATKFLRTKYSRCSADISEIEIDGLLMEYFKEHDYITTKEMQLLCKLSNATALRRLQKRVMEGTLTHPGHLRAPFYFPVPGNYGVSRG